MKFIKLENNVTTIDAPILLLIQCMKLISVINTAGTEWDIFVFVFKGGGINPYV